MEYRRICSFANCFNPATLCQVLPTSTICAGFCYEHYFIIREIRYDINDFNQCLANINAPNALSLWTLSDIDYIADLVAGYCFLKFYKKTLQQLQCIISQNVLSTMNLEEHIAVTTHNINLITDF